MTGSPTVEDVVTRALEAYEALVLLAEEVEDEWSYIQDLSGAWRAELERARGADQGPATASVVGAVDRLAAEVGRITDPHRAIDWMSTFPQAVLLAMGRDPWVDAA